MNRFKVGDVVIALSDQRNSEFQIRIKGHEYTVDAIQYCSNCGRQMINIGGISDAAYYCDYCSIGLPDNNFH